MTIFSVPPVSESIDSPATLINDNNLVGFKSSVNGEIVDLSYELQKGDIIRVGISTKNSGSKFDFSDWEKLADQVTKKWIGSPDAVEEIRYQRSKND